jgi:hypothetical protein
MQTQSCPFAFALLEGRRAPGEYGVRRLPLVM